MNNAFKPGVHNYYGKRNSRAQRFASKLYKGLKKPSKKLWDLLDTLKSGDR